MTDLDDEDEVSAVDLVCPPMASRSTTPPTGVVIEASIFHGLDGGHDRAGW